MQYAANKPFPFSNFLSAASKQYSSNLGVNIPQPVLESALSARPESQTAGSQLHLFPRTKLHLPAASPSLPSPLPYTASERPTSSAEIPSQGKSAPTRKT